MIDFSSMSPQEVIRFATQKERKPIPRKRSKPRKRKTVVRLTGEKLEALRAECWERDERRCVVCGKWLPLNGDLYARMHMAHVTSKGAGGSDTLENVVTKCYHDHIEVEHGLKWGERCGE